MASNKRFSVEGKRIIVVGASTGMGLSAASLLAEAGAKVVIASRSKSKLEEAKKVIGWPVAVHTLDIKSEPQVASFFADRGAFDHLVITAADAISGPFLEVPISAVQDFFDSKFWGAYRVARFGAPHIARTDRSRLSRVPLASGEHPDSLPEARSTRRWRRWAARCPLSSLPFASTLSRPG